MPGRVLAGHCRAGCVGNLPVSQIGPELVPQVQPRDDQSLRDGIAPADCDSIDPGGRERIAVAHCQPPQRHSDFLLGDSCAGKASTQGRRVEFFGVYRKDFGQTIAVHVTPGTGDIDEAVPDAWIVPPIAIGVGGVLGVAAVIGIGRRLRRAPVAADRPGRPWPGANS